MQRSLERNPICLLIMLPQDFNYGTSHYSLSLRCLAGVLLRKRVHGAMAAVRAYMAVHLSALPDLRLVPLADPCQDPRHDTLPDPRLVPRYVRSRIFMSPEDYDSYWLRLSVTQ